MKNLKIRAKILLSFGIVIALTLFFSIYVIFSSVSTMANVENMRAENHMQSLTANLSEYFALARTGANIISLTFDDAAFASLQENINKCNTLLKEINLYMSEHSFLESFRSGVSDTEKAISDWFTIVENIQAQNKALEAVIADAHVNQMSLEESSMGIFDYQMELARDEAVQEVAPASRSRRVDRIETGVTIGNNLNYIGSSFEVMFKSLMTANVADGLAVIAETDKILSDFLAESTLQYNIETATEMLDRLHRYEDNINDFLSLLDSRTASISQGKASGTSALATMNKLLTDVTDSSFSHADSTVKAASSSLIIVIIFSFVAFVAAVFFAMNLASIISVPLRKLAGTMTKLFKTGNVVLDPADASDIDKMRSSNDELGEIATALNGVMDFLNRKTLTLDEIAAGNLAAEVVVRSEYDTIGNALTKMSDGLNAMFREIRLSTEQVTAGSKQIADGAQALAQGSTEQAASVEQLSASVTSVAKQTKDNAELAARASRLADTIKANAEKGETQMSQMMAAVRDISKASQDIGKVIKVIDDIAFQTNILALNAAVEAARAGQHGKGFAVVAEEVRSLAAKSAEAAKDTGELIANSIEKAGLGASIADETASSLGEIVSGINESSEIVSTIAQSSDEQSAAIEQINIGIGQVSQVVQQNSATAEQSAAASEQMSGQSATLENLISQFRLRDSGAPGRLSNALPQPGRPAPSYSAYDDTDFSNSADFGKY